MPLAIIKIVLEMLAGMGAAGGARWGAGKLLGKGVAGAAGKAFAGMGAGRALERGLTGAARASPAWLARRMPTAESLARGAVSGAGGLGEMVAFLGGMRGAGSLLESDEAPTAYDWPGTNAMPTPDRERERIALDEYTQQAALKQALQAFIQGEGARRIV